MNAAQRTFQPEVARRSALPTARPPAVDARHSGVRKCAPGEKSGNELIRSIIDSFDRGDILGALGTADKLLATRRVPIVVAARENLRDFGLDHREGFVLSLVDGASALDSIFDIAGLPMLELLRLLCQLVQKRVIVVLDPI